MKINTFAHLVISAAVLLFCNLLILQKEAVLKSGTTVLLRLAPKDPRSLMQGDYMILRYEIAGQLNRAPDKQKSDGLIVIRLDDKNIASFVRIYNAEPLAPGEHLLKYRPSRYGQVRLGAESFFFQEGDATRFEGAKYGELKVAADGSSVLANLRNEALEPLRKPSH